MAKGNVEGLPQGEKAKSPVTSNLIRSLSSRICSKTSWHVLILHPFYKQSHRRMKLRHKPMMYILYQIATHPMNTPEFWQGVVEILPLEEKHHCYCSGDHTHLSSNAWKWRFLTVSSTFPPLTLPAFLSSSFTLLSFPPPIPFLHIFFLFCF